MKHIYTPILTLAVLALLALPASAQNCLNFDGSSNAVNCGQGAALKIHNASEITLEAWIKPTAWRAAALEGTIFVMANVAPAYGYGLSCGDGGKVNFFLGGSAGNHNFTTTSAVLTLNTWQHLAGTYDGDTMRIYVDGVEVEKTAQMLDIDQASQNFTIGNNVTGLGGQAGDIDEIRLWDVARTEEEIMDNMDNLICDDPASLVAYYTFNEGNAGGVNTSVTTLTDISGNGNNGTLDGSFGLSGSTSNWVASGVSFDDEPDVTVTQSNDTIMANASTGTYTWIDCSDNSVVAGATSQTFIASANGQYALVMGTGVCADTSACQTISVISVDELPEKTSIKVFPNPANNKFTISLDKAEETKVSVINLAGQTVSEEVFNTNNIEMNSSSWEQGIYLISIESATSRYTERLIIE